ncbi:high-affinity choline transporter 1 [Salvelinus sp. IW2-2015]|uniref:high-affinity choline transporter 1 n=1 Tax=Salvelinus sp. IW2-2015 TaxID=2691554 RepID=UPI000CDF9EF9|nr:high-affinity choline transporter 1 [Salvelinus alpinus]
MALNWPGLLSIGVFYLIVLATGVWASRKSKHEERKCTGNLSEVAMVGGRNLNIWVSIFTTTATWVGGGFILGNAEVVYDPKRGLAWAIGPIGFTLSLVVGALFFVKPVREKNYVTIMDPFQEKYGNTLTAILFVPSLLADIFWIACVLAALGGTVSVIMDIPSPLAVALSAAVAILYTLLGGLYSVAYTDVIQLIFMFLSLWFCVPFILMSPASTDITVTAVTKLYQEPWTGRLKLADAGRWLDDLLLVTLGGICYQSFYQRVLATATVAQAQFTCYAASVFCFILAIPPLLIGAVAASTDWNQTSFGLPTPYEQGKAGMILPISLHHLCPHYVSLAGIGAIAAAVMSSIDSALLSSASLFARNIYKNIFSKRASEKQILLVVKVSILLFGLMGAGLAMTTSSVYVFWILSGDVMYTVVCAQLICVLFLPGKVNGYGALAGLVVGLLLRFLVGEPLLGVPGLMPLPWDSLHEDGRLLHVFPFRTGIMLVSLATILIVSRFAACLFLKGLLPDNWDVYELGQKRRILIKDMVAKDLTEKIGLNTRQMDPSPHASTEDMRSLQ